MEHTKNETIIHDTDKESSWEQQMAMKVLPTSDAE